MNRNSLTHYKMILKLIKASREAVKTGHAVVLNRHSEALLSIIKLPSGRLLVLVVKTGQDVTTLVSSVLFDNN